jgi:aspartyl-tRNA(Asn)/glutamyl-tRNA(Gln) amidotransferase subunit C
MALTLEEVRRIAALARLRLSADEELRFVSQLARIVEHIDHLAEYSSAPVAAEGPPAAEADDTSAPCLPRAFVLGNAPETFDEFVVVPQVKGDDHG